MCDKWGGAAMLLIRLNNRIQAMVAWADSKAATVTLINPLAVTSDLGLSDIVESPEQRLFYFTFSKCSMKFVRTCVDENIVRFSQRRALDAQKYDDRGPPAAVGYLSSLKSGSTLNAGRRPCVVLLREHFAVDRGSEK